MVIDYNNLIISDSACESFAMAILPDIASYIQANRKDYDLWLEQNYNKRIEVNQ